MDGKQSETTVPQSSQAVSVEWETVGETPSETVPKSTQETTGETVSETVRETTIVSAKGEDVSKWRKYAVTYYKRSIKKVSDDLTKRAEQLETRKRNREEYEHWRDLLLAAGFKIEELKDRLVITNPSL